MASNPGFTQPCPHCKVPLLLRDLSWIGKLVECPRCKQRFTVEDPARKATAPEPPAMDKEALIRKDREAVQNQEQARKEALIQKDREAVRGKQPASDGNGAKPVAPKAAQAPPKRDKVRLEPLFAVGQAKKNVSGGHRKQAKGVDGGVNLGIIITPMLDMAFQLLAFFVATYHPSALERHIDGSLLPPANIAVKGTPDQNPTPVDTPPDDKDTVLVTVKSVKSGQIGGKHDGEAGEILLKRPEDANPEKVADASQDLDTGLKELAARLKAIQSKGTKANINIAADSDLKNQYFIRVYDVCKGAKFENIGFVAPTDAPDAKK